MERARVWVNISMVRLKENSSQYIYCHLGRSGVKEKGLYIRKVKKVLPLQTLSHLTKKGGKERK